MSRATKDYTKYTDLDLSEEINQAKEQNIISVKESDVVFGNSHQEDLADDYKFIRKKLNSLIENSETVMERSLTSISEEATPRAIEAFTALVKTIADTTDRMIVLHEKQHKLEKEIHKDKNDDETDDSSKKKKITTNLTEILKDLDELKKE